MRTTPRFLQYPAAACLAVLLVFAGCAKAPQEEIQAARQAVDTARSAGAGDYAPESLRRAEELMAQLDTELQAQQQKVAFTRSYKEANRLALEARHAADQAGIDAATGKETERTQAQALLGEARTAIDSARGLLASAPAGKGAQVEIEAMRSDLAAAEMKLGEAERAWEEGRFREAHTQADAAKSVATQIVNDITSAKTMQRSGRS